MRDRGNQLTLGVLLGAFGYALIVLRSVRGGEDSPFVPSLGVTIGLILAACCIGLLIYFIHHVATRINVDTVMDLVHDDVLKGMARLTLDRTRPLGPDAIDWEKGQEISMPDDGHLQQIETSRSSIGPRRTLRHPLFEKSRRVRLSACADRARLQTRRGRRGSDP